MKGDGGAPSACSLEALDLVYVCGALKEDKAQVSERERETYSLYTHLRLKIGLHGKAELLGRLNINH